MRASGRAWTELLRSLFRCDRSTGTGTPYVVAQSMMHQIILPLGVLGRMLSAGGTWGTSRLWLFKGVGSAPYGSTRDFAGIQTGMK